MKILLSWLRDFVDVRGTAEDIARTMSVRGFAVEGIETVDVASPDGTRAADSVIDFEVTSNRPDCMSVMGMAREVATAYGLQVRRPTAGASSLNLVSLKPAEASAAGIDVVIQDAGLCPRYVGAVADVTVGPSPDWMQARLRAAGVRPISNIVDVTNYVLIELGHPMHAFDHARLKGAEIRVRVARPGERVRTLDNVVRELSPEMLVIADAQDAVAVAGVMGGADSEVADATRVIVLESAYFNPLSVRRTSRKLQLKTEASVRFERGADPRMPVIAMERACALLEAVGAGRARGTMVDRYPARVEPGTVRLRYEKIAGLIGVEIPESDVRRILESLGFALRDADAAAASPTWDVTVPTRRIDVLREVDLIEEVARHVGFDRVAARFPAVVAAPPRVDPRITRARQLRTVMTGAGFFEAMTFGFMGAAAAQPFAAGDEVVGIRNPLSDTFAVLRPSALPGLIDAVAHNRRREQRDVRLFEIGARFSRRRGERRAIACAWTGTIGGDHWSGGTRQVDFFDIKGIVERICEALGLQPQIAPHEEPWLVRGRTASASIGGSRIGVFGQLSPSVVESHGLPSGDPVYVAEIDLDAAEASIQDSARVEPLPRYPSVTRDISILVDGALPSADVRRTIRDAAASAEASAARAPAMLTRIREFDRYQGKGIPEDKISLSLRLTFRSQDRTLTDAEVQQAMDRVIAALKEKHGAVQR